MSFYTALSGLQASQTEMSTISHNLANVSTNGFKKSRTEFADVISSSLSLSPTQMVGSGTVVKANRQQFGQGNLIQSSNTLDLAISGDGFFAVKTDLNAQQVNFTRNGGFQVDNDRYVVDSTGGHLQVYPVDGSGAVVATGLDSAVSLRLPQTSGLAVPTTATALTLQLNANTQPTTADFDRFDPTTYSQSIQNTVYDSNGNALTMTTYLARATTPTTANSNTSTWNAYSFLGDQPLKSGGSDKVALTFDSTNALTAPTATTTFDPVLTTTSKTEQQLSLMIGANTTQLSAPFNVVDRTQNGKAVGQLEGVTVGVDGLVKASFSNGDTKALGQVMLANFSSPEGLRQQGNSYWQASGVSGDPVLGTAGSNGFGKLMSSTIERSNVDITEELVGLIAAQRNFQANAKALDTASQISQTIFNIRS
ncbi:flagellar hook protein FlgE [Sphingomonas sp.]|uniref:flagellar hook protein FlgE n=1 Tax=Sphingomonas sp. TaxID=28214 RepID=UPI0035BBAA38